MRRELPELSGVGEMMLTIHKFTLPWPPSMNTYWRSVVIKGRVRVLLSKKGREYRRSVANSQDVVAWVKHYHPMPTRMKMLIDVFPPDKRRRDLDNLPKGIQDGLQNAEVYMDDCQIDDLHLVRKEIIKGGKVVVTITEML